GHPGVGSDTEGDIKGPSCVGRSLYKKRYDGQHASRYIEIPRQEVEARKKDVLGADLNGNQKIPEDNRHYRNYKKKNHDDAVQGESGIVGLGADYLVVYRHEFSSHEETDRHADEEPEQDHDKI